MWNMTLQTIRFRIRPDGRVEERVEGVIGPACQQLTRSIENRLGVVQVCQPSADHYRSANVSIPLEHTSHVALQHGSN